MTQPRTDTSPDAWGKPLISKTDIGKIVKVLNHVTNESTLHTVLDVRDDCHPNIQIKPPYMNCIGHQVNYISWTDIRDGIPSIKKYWKEEMSKLYNTPETQTMISMPKLMARLDLTRHGILKWVREGKFPKPLKPGGHYGHAYWRIEDVEKWERGEFKNG